MTDGKNDSIKHSMIDREEIRKIARLAKLSVPEEELDGLTADRPCVLEVELPETDLARRRIGFYRRHGFAWNDYPYMQPALRPTESPIPLRLMTRNAPLPEEEFHRRKKEIYKTVYGVE